MLSGWGEESGKWAGARSCWSLQVMVRGLEGLAWKSSGEHCKSYCQLLVSDLEVEVLVKTPLCWADSSPDINNVHQGGYRDD